MTVDLDSRSHPEVRSRGWGFQVCGEGASWSAGQVATETAGLNGQSSGWHPQTAGIGAFCRPESRLPLDRGGLRFPISDPHWS